MTRGNSIKGKTDIRVTNAAARYFYGHFAAMRIELGEVANLQRRIDCV